MHGQKTLKSWRKVWHRTLMKRILSKADVTYPTQISESDAWVGVGIKGEWGGAESDWDKILMFLSVTYTRCVP